MTVKAILFGGIGTLLETSEIQRMAFNEAFNRCDLDWHWDRDAYLDMLAIPGGVQRILRYAEAQGETAIDQEAAERLHADKTAHFHAAIKEGGLSARDGVEPLVSHCLNANIALGFATTTDAQTARAVLDAIAASDLEPDLKDPLLKQLRRILDEEDTHLEIATQHNHLLEADRAGLSPKTVELLDQLEKLTADDYEYAAELSMKQIAKTIGRYAEGARYRAQIEAGGA